MRRWLVQTVGWLLVLALLATELYNLSWLGHNAAAPALAITSVTSDQTALTNATISQLSAPDPITAAESLMFVRHVLALLEQGDPMAIDLLAWESLHIAGHDVGLSFRDIGDQAAFQAEFIAGVAQVFAESNNAVAEIQNWRVQTREPSKIVIAAELPSEVTIVLTVIMHDQQLLLEGIEFNHDRNETIA